MREVAGSNPVVPTIFSIINGCQLLAAVFAFEQSANAASMLSRQSTSHRSFLRLQGKSGVKLKTTRIMVKDSASVLAFETTGNEHWKQWDRFLTVEGKPAYHIGNVCGTCEFFFERLEGANQSISPTEISDKLRQGLKNLDESLLVKIKSILPDGEYVASLLEVLPARVIPGSGSDYFSHEQVELWGIDGFWNLPHYPKTEYYRTRTEDLGEQRRLFEFIIPMFPKNWLKADECNAFEISIGAGQQPTALALSVLDIKQPATWHGEPTVTEHWCLAHYLLDGHHKMFAASVVNKPITLLSFLSVGESLATEENLRQLIDYS